MNTQRTATPEVRAFVQRCQKVSAEIEKRISAAKHPKPEKARTYLWCNWLRRNGFMGGDHAGN